MQQQQQQHPEHRNASKRVKFRHEERISLSSGAAEFSVFPGCEGMRCASLETKRGRSVKYFLGSY
jgi:hypothetical protein